MRAEARVLSCRRCRVVIATGQVAETQRCIVRRRIVETHRESVVELYISSEGAPSMRERIGDTGSINLDDPTIDRIAAIEYDSR